MTEDASVDLRVERTQRAIKEAFRELVCEKDAGRITVKELTERAGINRKTFYLHFQSIEELYSAVLQDIMDKYFRERELTPEKPKDIWGHARRFFLYLTEQPLSTERMVCSPGGYDDFGKKLYFDQMRRYREAGKDPFGWMPGAKHELVLNFIRSTALNFYRQWVKDGKAVDPEEAADLLCELTCHGVDRLMK
ncbi:TetR/AcrR family transcriptional regulator [Slackia piriformis]|jgi:AcrR family transcriptional regulator|nr:TetR/AcrR family transcriptional regulator [Slackia piriformis]